LLIISENFSNGQLWRTPITAINSSLKIKEDDTKAETPIQKIQKQVDSSQVTNSKVSSLTKINPEINTGLSAMITKNEKIPQPKYNAEPIIASQQIMTPSNRFSLESSKKIEPLKNQEIDSLQAQFDASIKFSQKNGTSQIDGLASNSLSQMNESVDNSSISKKQTSAYTVSMR
jgi:hypothetical protein